MARKATCAWAALLLAAALGGCGHAHRTDVLLLLNQSRALSPAQVAQIEARLERHPKDLEARARLLGFYQGQFRSEEGRKAYARHALWVIREQPRSALAGPPATMLDPRLDRDSYDAAAKLWREHLAGAPFDAVLYENAARFHMAHDKEAARDILIRAAATDPVNPLWPQLLGQLYWLQRLPDSSLDKQREAAARSHAEYEKCLALTKEEAGRFYLLDSAAKTAIAAALPEKARAYSVELLALAPRYRNNWNYGNAIHDGHAVLGLVALSEGNVAEANAQLLQAGATPGSPQLDTFGPNVILARELLAKGERETVLRYFELCRKFWESGGDTLSAWSRAVQKGEAPVFGGNLNY